MATGIGPSPDAQLPLLMHRILFMGLQQWLPQSIYTAGMYGVFDVLGKRGALTLDEIVQETPSVKNATLMQQVLRHLAANGILIETNKLGKAAYQLTDIAQLMRTDVPGQPCLAPAFFCEDPYPWNSLSRLAEAVSLPKYEGLFPLQNAGRTYLEYMKDNKIAGQLYISLAGTIATMQAPLVLSAFAQGFAELDRRAATIIDFGGNMGRVIGAIKSQFQNIRALSVDLAQNHQVTMLNPPAGVELHTLSVLDPAMVPLCDMALICNSLLNYDDDKMIPFLLALQARLNKGGLVALITVALPEPGEIKPEAILGFSWNLHVTQYGGRLRTVTEWTKLFNSNGFNIIHASKLGDIINSTLFVVQAV